VALVIKEAKMAEKLAAKFDVHTLLCRSVSAMVGQYAEMISEETGVGVLAVEADLYRFLEVNCRDKAKLAEAFAAERP